MSIGFIHNFTQFVSLRALLGMAEGGLFPGMVIHDDINLAGLSNTDSLLPAT
jgi:hypothetical protein